MQIHMKTNINLRLIFPCSSSWTKTCTQLTKVEKMGQHITGFIYLNNNHKMG